MIRHAAAVIVGLCLSVPPLSAQTTTVTLKVDATAAAVHKAPTLASPVIGKALRDTTLLVTRELGDWVKVSWPTAADGVGYLRTNVGTIARGGAGAQTNARAGVAAGATAAPALTSTPVPDQASEPAAASPSSAPASSASALTLASAPAPTPTAAVPTSPVPAADTQSATAMPARTISADAGYYHLRPPFVGLDPSGVGFAVSGHWYVK